MTAPIFMVAMCMVGGGGADQCLPMHNSPIFASLNDCERWIADVTQPESPAIDIFCIKREVSALGLAK